MNVKQIVFILLGTVAMAACSPTKFSTKSAVLAKTSVFASRNAGDEYNGQVNQPSTDEDSGGVIKQPGSDGTGGNISQPGSDGAGGNVSQPINEEEPVHYTLNDGINLTRMCSDALSSTETTFKRAVAQNLPMSLLINNKVCTSNASVIKDLVTKKDIITFGEMAKICPSLNAMSPNASVALKLGNSTFPSYGDRIYVAYAMNKGTSPASEVADDLCAEKTSPLVIHLNSDPTRPLPIALSAPEDGVTFDILGNNMPVRISWFTNNEYGLLALPDSAGRVRNINELFGNATIGPDNKSADDGYAALAKYDGTTEDGRFQSGKADGFIDQRDAVYSRLRVWVDRNHDGIAQPHELKSLRASGITYIDLSYSTEFAETDKHGNETLMKSVVGRSDGSMDLIFDLWFKIDLN
ncbi:MAG: hypothetical protein KF799_10670 [Bdellovibrionales bacterium]|nr:hypothetical protein [Bdellovibrionales bacterium]